MLRILGFGLVLALAGCSGGDGSGSDPGPDPVCEAGRVAECPCVDSTMGVQTCDDDGGGWGECKCAGDQAGPTIVAPKEYKADDVCSRFTENFDTTEGCGVAGVRIFEKCAVPEDGVLVGCVAGRGSLKSGFCCF